MVRADVDYYNVLGVDRNAEKKEIKQAYRSASSQTALSQAGNPVFQRLQACSESSLLAWLSG